MTVTLYDVARREAAKVAPSLTEDQLDTRILQAKTILGSSRKGSHRNTLASAALTVFEEEREQRVTIMPGYPETGPI